ncbi:hypothetical protein GJ744_007205 [Endocarpon pusillum]|uniref:Uncharacterized protein n=1 Tax=Endocarpon pusillum TaxID=364733 RepID=A0A8H7DXX6_9EURO|nr:hypothetical protein GJ744_007205 [Endocarpon pusillum]
MDLESLSQLKASVHLLRLDPSHAPEINERIERVSKNGVTEHEAEDFVRFMYRDSTVYVWTLKYIEAEETKVAPRVEVMQRLRGLINTRFCLTISHTEILANMVQSAPRNVALTNMALAQLRSHEHALTLSMIITPPSEYVRRSFRNHLRERSSYRMQVRAEVNWMLGRPILSERQRSRATELLSECNVYADGSDSPTQGDPSMQPATRAPPSERPSRRHHGSSEEGATPRSCEDHAQAPKASNQQGIASSNQQEAASSNQQGAASSNQQRTASAPPYPRGDLIDLVASKKASTNQTRKFHSQAVHNEAFRQQAIERLKIYSAASEEKKHKKLRAALESVKSDRMRLTTAASSQQTGQTREEEGQSKGSPAPKQPAASTRPVPSLTRQEKLAQQYRQDLDQLNQQIEELERDSEIKSLSQVSAELKIGIETMRLQGMQQLATTKRVIIGEGGPGAPRGTAEATEAVERFFSAHFRFLELSMLANESGSKAKAKAEEIRASLARPTSSVATRVASSSP